MPAAAGAAAPPAAGGRSTWPNKAASWWVTVFVQAVLCLALFGALRAGQPQPSSREPLIHLPSPSEDAAYFLSVGGGARSPAALARLLRQMERLTVQYKPKFVLYTGRPEEKHPLSNNVTLYSELLKIPWYSTTTLRGEVTGNFVEKIKISVQQIIEIVGIDTRTFQESSEVLLSDIKHVRELVSWLQQALARPKSNWRIAFGFSSLMFCNKMNKTERVQLYEHLRSEFVRYGVDVYVSTAGCAGYFHQDKSLMYVGNPQQACKQCSNVSSNTGDGFLLHRVGVLEMESYLVNSVDGSFVNSLVHRKAISSM